MFAKILDVVSRYQIVMILFMLAIGFLIPEPFLPLERWNTLFLQIILFATGLRTDFREFVTLARDWRTLILANAMMLLLLPYLVSIPLALFAPEWVLPFVLIAALPTALTAPAVMSILGGNVSLAVLASVSTNLLAPFTVPVVLRILVGAEVEIDILGMMRQIAATVLIPLGIAALIQWKWGKRRVERFINPIRLANLLAFALVIVSVAASSAEKGVTDQRFLGIGVDGILVIAFMMVYWFGIAFLSTTLLTWRNATDRMTLTFCLVYMSSVLGIWIADNFFPEKNMSLQLIAIFIGATLTLPLFKLFVPEEKKKTYHRIHTVEKT